MQKFNSFINFDFICSNQCLVSYITTIEKISFHEITTQIPHFVYVALPKDAHKPVISYPPMRFFGIQKNF